jgi:hypothetical protein
MNLRGSETVLFLLLAAAAESREKKANYQKRETSGTTSFGLKAMLV